jgi:hypothetical protein
MTMGQVADDEMGFTAGASKNKHKKYLTRKNSYGNE